MALCCLQAWASLKSVLLCPPAGGGLWASPQLDWKEGHPGPAVFPRRLHKKATRLSGSPRTAGKENRPSPIDSTGSHTPRPSLLPDILPAQTSPPHRLISCIREWFICLGVSLAKMCECAQVSEGPSLHRPLAADTYVSAPPRGRGPVSRV